MNAELEEYKERVRKEAIRVAQEQEWCDDGLNQALRNLDLPEKKNFRVPVQVISRRVVFAEVIDANSQEEANAKVLDRQWQIDNGFDYPEVELAKPKDPEEQTMGDIDTTFDAVGPRCRKTDRRGWSCTRERAHEGQHISGNSEMVQAVWPQEAD